jgi:hypothetical protein
MKTTWKLPNGEYTSNVKKMIKAWKDIYEPICRVTGSSVIGYDPGILFKGDIGGTFDLPVSFAQKITELIKSLEYCANHARPSIVSDIAKKALTPPVRLEPDFVVNKKYWGSKPKNTKGIGGGWERYKG